MPDQRNYYNHFGNQFKQSILQCPEPEYWTTDYESRGRIYTEMKERVDRQKEIILSHFIREKPVLDIGCGFGRQAFLLTKLSFSVTGFDTSDVFIDIADELFQKHHLKGNFLCTDILKSIPKAEKFTQVILFDVFEHIPPFQRRKFIYQLSLLTDNRVIIIISVPHVKERFSSQINNRIRKRITQHFLYFRNREEHPYPVPQKKDILKAIHGVFSLVSVPGTAGTAYYVLRKPN